MINTSNSVIKVESAVKSPSWWAGEELVLSIGSVRLRGSSSLKGSNGPGLSSYLTTHRFVWKKKSKDRPSTLCFASFDRPSASKRISESTSSVDYILWSYFEIQKAVRILAIDIPLRSKITVMFGTSSLGGKSDSLKIRTSKTAFDKTYTKLLEVHSNEAWKSVPAPVSTVDQQFASSGVGVVRHIDRQKKKALEQSDAVSLATADIKILQTNSESLVTIARQLRQTTKYNNPETEAIARLLNEFGLSDTDVQFDEKDTYFCNVANTLKVLLMKVLPPDGSPPTKSTFDHTTGNISGTYNTNTLLCPPRTNTAFSSQVSAGSNSRAPVQKFGSMNGTMLVHEVYCVYCRVPGAPVVSPADFLAAVKNISSNEESPHMYREFRDGAVKAIQLRSMTDEAIATRLVALVEECELEFEGTSEDQEWRGISANQLAKKFDCSVALALSQLKMAEAKSLLCRDESWAGLFFYRNVIALCFNELRTATASRVSATVTSRFVSSRPPDS